MQMNENKQSNTLLAICYIQISRTLQFKFLKIQTFLTHVQEIILTEIQLNKKSQKDFAALTKKHVIQQQFKCPNQ